MRNIGFKIAGIGCFAAIGVILAHQLPTAVLHPNWEADADSYTRVQSILNPDGYYSDACPALRLEANKALNDGKLTISEVAALQKRAIQLTNQNTLQEARNEALYQAGKPTTPAVDCPRGGAIFSD